VRLKLARRNVCHTVPAAVAPQALLASFDRATPNNFEDAPLDPELLTSFDKDDQDDLVGD
jgi:hypothetical protein